MIDEQNSWCFRHLTLFCKVTIIKTMCLPKFTHIGTIIPNLCLTRLNEIEKEWEAFIKAKGCPMVNKETRYLPTKDNGLGMLRLAVFWKSVRMVWLRRLTTKRSTWKRLHAEGAGSCMFDLVNSTMDTLEEERRRMDNLVWKDIYSALL